MMERMKECKQEGMKGREGEETTRRLAGKQKQASGIGEQEKDLAPRNEGG